MEIQDRLLTVNPYSRSGESQGSIQYIVVHYVGNAGSSAIGNRNYFENLKNTHSTYASSHYIVGLNGEIIRCIPDDEVAFHAGSHSMNRKSIGIENCHPDWSGEFNSETFDSLTSLCASLCQQYGIPVSNVIRHYDVTGKCCPKYYVENPSEWNALLNAIQVKINGGEYIPPKPDEGGIEDMQTWKNGSTSEPVYQHSNMTKKIGSLSPYEQCQAVKINDTCFMVYYGVDGTNYEKCGFVKYNGGI